MWIPSSAGTPENSAHLNVPHFDRSQSAINLRNKVVLIENVEHLKHLYYFNLHKDFPLVVDPAVAEFWTLSLLSQGSPFISF